MLHSVPRIQKNTLLACLPDNEREEIINQLEVVPMDLGVVVYEADTDMPCVYFPIDCVISLLHLMRDGGSAEIAMVGNEGMVGVVQVVGGRTTNSHAVVQAAGQAFRLESIAFKRAFGRGGAFQKVVLRYMQALMAMTTQTAACNHYHPPAQQLSRWLLMSMDRMPESPLIMTKGLIANMLGLRSDGASDAIGKLQSGGLIHYENGTFSKLDRLGLERHTCECYRVVKDEFARLLPPDAA